MRDITRFAPSPNGWLHLGHAFSAITAHDYARDVGGTFLLRIEDIDLGRCRPEYIEGIYKDLTWLGLTWDGPVRLQSQHFSDYEIALKELRDRGLVYQCFATRKEINDAILTSGIGFARWPLDPDGAPVYPGLYKNLEAGEVNRLMWEGRTYAWRLDMEKALAEAERLNGGPITFTEIGQGPLGQKGILPIDPLRYGDVIIARKDVPTSYHLAVTLDDAAQGITTVTRGQDLFPATYVHRVLQILLGLPEPRYRHHGLIRDETGRRLSKTAKDQGLRDLRKAGVTPADIRARIGL